VIRTIRFAVFDVDEHGTPIHEWKKTASEEEARRYVSEQRALGYDLAAFELLPLDRVPEPPPAPRDGWFQALVRRVCAAIAWPLPERTATP
jgi:hypothetical protein